MTNAAVTATCVAAALSAAAAQTMDLEWNVRYDTAVPYEVELSPAKLEKLAGVPKGSGFAVKADGRDLGAVAFAGKAPGTVDLRFKVLEGTKRLACEAGEGKLDLADSSRIDNLFAGALDAANAGRWCVPKDVKVSAEAGGLLFASTAFANRKVSYVVDVPKRFAGKPVKVEFDVTSRSKMVWAGMLKVRQLDAAGQELPESLSDPRWTSQMRPPQKFTAYREDGVIHPRARKLRLDIGLWSDDRDIDEYGMPLKDKSGLYAQLFVSRIAVRPAAQLPFPKYDDTFFEKGVSGEPGDQALALGGKYSGGFWYQTHSQACWAEGYEFRDENDCFFPAKAGTVEAWFKADWPKMAGDVATLFDYYQGYSGLERRQGKGSLMALRWNRASGELGMELRDAADRTFNRSAKVKLPSGRWFHVAAQWKPGGKAEVFVDGKPVLAYALDGFAAFDITDKKINHPNDIAGMEFFLGANPKGTLYMNCEGSGRSNPLLEGAVDSFRASSGCRYSGEFVPAKRFAPDGDTRALFDFDRSFDGVAGGGAGFILGSFRASSDRVDHKLEIGGRKVQYFPAKMLPENNPDVVLDVNNYPVVPKAAEYTAARREVRRSFDMKAGGRAAYDVPEGAYPDYVEIANTGDTTLVYPLVLGKGELDPRSFGDLAEGLALGNASDREKVNRLFQMVISASDYFMNYNAIFPYGSDMPKSVCYDAMVVLNGYCGFECGPLNNLAANMFATVANCPAVQTGGYGHSFEEVFFDGKNHIYDLSAQKFFPAMDNETAAYLREVEDQPGIHNRVKYSPSHFMRKGTRGYSVWTPDYRPKVGVCLNPGESFRVWRGNNGEVNNLQCKTSHGKGPFKWSTPASKIVAPIYEKESGSDHKDEPIRRIDRFFPDLSSGFLSFGGKPERGNPAFTNVTADSFCYNVKSGYPITWARYGAKLSDGTAAELEISTNFKDYRALPAPGEDGAVTLDYLVRARNGYWIRVKAPIDKVASFDAVTEVQVNRRTFPGHAKPGRNEFTLKSASAGKARVTVQWRENVKDVQIAGGAFSGTIPGFERQTVLIDDPAKPLSLAVSGLSPSAKAVATKGLKATLAGGALTVAAADAKAEPFTGAVTIDDNGAKRELTVIVCAGARLAFAKDGTLTGAAEKVEPDADRVQGCVMLRKAGDGVKLAFDPIPAGEYIVFNCERFPGGLLKGENRSRVLRFKVPGAKKGEEWQASGSAVNGNCDYLKAPYGRRGQRGNWKWDYPFLEEERGATHNGWEIKSIPFAATGELEFKLSDSRPDGVELAAALVFPSSVSHDFIAELKKLLCGLNCQPVRVVSR